MIYLIRHGETEWSLSGRHTGKSADIPLTQNGEEQARDVAKLLHGKHFDKVFTSPLQRAKKTCEIAGFLAHAKIDPDLVEWDYGDYEGITGAEIRKNRPSWQLFSDGAPNGESVEQISNRIDRFLEKIGSPQKEIAIFSSGHVLRVLIARWLGLSASYGRYFLLETGSMTFLGLEKETKVLISPTPKDSFRIK